MALRKPSEISDISDKKAQQIFLEDIPQDSVTVAESEDLVLFPPYAFPAKLTVVGECKNTIGESLAVGCGDPFVEADVTANKLRMWMTGWNGTKVGIGYSESTDGMTGLTWVSPKSGGNLFHQLTPTTATENGIETFCKATLSRLNKTVAAYYCYPTKWVPAGVGGRIGCVFFATLGHFQKGAGLNGMDLYIWDKFNNSPRIKPEYDWEQPWITSPLVLDGGIQEINLLDWGGKNVVFYSTITMMNCKCATSGAAAGYKDPTIAGGRYSGFIGRAEDIDGNMAAFTREKLPVIALGEQGGPDADLMTQQDVIPDPIGVPGEGHMFYRGYSISYLGFPNVSTICHAFTQDYGRTWYKNPNNPLLTQTNVTGNLTSGYARLLNGPTGRIINNQWVVFFGGSNDTYATIKLYKATAPRVIT